MGRLGLCGTCRFTARLVLFNSDNKPHKVTVVVLTLDSTFQHYSPVCKVASAYLQATCVNTSEYTLLPSKEVCVFAGEHSSIRGIHRPSLFCLI